MTTDRNTNPFARLDKSRFPKVENPKTRTAKPAPAPPPDNGLDDAALFLHAVGNAAPLRHQEEEDNFARLFAGQQSKGKDINENNPAPNTSVSSVPTPVPSALASPTPDTAIFPDDAELFAAAVGGAAPVRAKGRDLTPPPVVLPPRQHKPERSLEDLLAGKVEFALEYSDEFIEGHIMGLDPLVQSKLRAGQYSPEGHLDLHGQNMEQAYASLARFIKVAYQDGKRQVLLITGRGKNSPGGDAVLRERVQTWLTRDPFKRVTLAFCTAQPRDGGAGALYLLLRKRKKNQGKIIWDRVPSAEELLL